METQGRRECGRQGECDGIEAHGRAEAHLEVHRRGRTIEQSDSIEVGAPGNPVHFLYERLELLIEGLGIRRADRAVCGLNRKLAHADEHGVALIECTLCGLGQRYAIVGIAFGLAERAHM